MPVKRKAKAKPTPPSPPKKHTERYTKATVVLFDRQVAFLDETCAAVKRETGKSLKRAEIIRALVDALEGSGIQPQQLATEDELRALAALRLKRK